MRQKSNHKGDDMRRLPKHNRREHEGVPTAGEGPTADAKIAGRPKEEWTLGERVAVREGWLTFKSYTFAGVCWSCRQEKTNLSECHVCLDCVIAVKNSPAAVAARRKIGKRWEAMQCHS